MGMLQLQPYAGYTYVDPKYRNFNEIDTTKSTVSYNILKYRMKHAVRADLGLVYHGIRNRWIPPGTTARWRL